MVISTEIYCCLKRERDIGRKVLLSERHECTETRVNDYDPLTENNVKKSNDKKM